MDTTIDLLSAADRRMLDMWAQHVGEDDPGSPGPALNRLLRLYNRLTATVCNVDTRGGAQTPLVADLNWEEAP